MTMHPVLRRQLAKLGVTPDAPPSAEEWRAALERVSHAYEQADRERAMLERSLKVSSDEMQELYSELRTSSEAELRRVNRRLEDSLALARSIEESVADALFVIDEHGAIVEHNARFLELARMDPDEIRGRSYKALGRRMPALRARLDAIVALDQVTTCEDLEVDEGRVLELFVGPILAEGKATGARIVSLRDVTMQRKLASERMVSLERMASLGQSLAAVAHELAGPIAFLTSNLEFLAETTTGSADATAAIADCQDAAERLTTITQELRTAARPPVEAGETSIDIQAAAETASRIARVQTRTTVPIELDVEEGAAFVGSEPHLVQILSNLVANAAQACEGRGVASHVRLRARGSGDRVRIEVEDDGPGVSPEHAARVFEPFFTTKPVGKGTGLGLWICKAIAERMGGFVHLDATYARGARFVLDLPTTGRRITQPPASGTRHSEHTRAAPPASSGSAEGD